MDKTKKNIKTQQAQMQTDAMELDGFSEGITYGGNAETGTLHDASDSLTFEFGEIDMFSEEDMRKKYPALKQAHEHYQSVLEICKTKEKEEDED